MREGGGRFPSKTRRTKESFGDDAGQRMELEYEPRAEEKEKTVD